MRYAKQKKKLKEERQSPHVDVHLQFLNVMVSYYVINRILGSSPELSASYVKAFNNCI